MRLAPGRGLVLARLEREVNCDASKDCNRTSSPFAFFRGFMLMGILVTWLTSQKVPPKSNQEAERKRSPNTTRAGGKVLPFRIASGNNGLQDF